MEPTSDTHQPARQDEPVPRVVRPQVAVPEDVATAVEMLRYQLRVEILRELRGAAAARTGRELASALGVDYERSFQRHLAALEEVGVLLGAPPVRERQGQLVRYQLDPGVLATLLAALSRHLQGTATTDTRRS
jgi:DNA-binding transcriptional ArsR family regulator